MGEIIATKSDPKNDTVLTTNPRIFTQLMNAYREVLAKGYLVRKTFREKVMNATKEYKHSPTKRLALQKKLERNSILGSPKKFEEMKALASLKMKRRHNILSYNVKKKQRSINVGTLEINNKQVL